MRLVICLGVSKLENLLFGIINPFIDILELTVGRKIVFQFFPKLIFFIQKMPRVLVVRRRSTVKLRPKITALACGQPPEGHARWSLRLLAENIVALEYCESISYVQVDKILKK